MRDSVSGLLSGIIVHSPQVYDNITVYPLSNECKIGPDYIPLEEALETELLTITERTEAGSVPELLAINHSEQAVLIISGEEVIGARQNRIMNASMLLRGKTTTILPVSCSEQGRWHYKSRTFGSSKFISSPSLRKAKMEGVTRSLRHREMRVSDQGKVWDKIDELSRKSESRSPTKAFSDILEDRSGDLKTILDHFPLLPGQTGMLVFLGSTPVMLEFVSKPEVFGRIHFKALAGCVIDAGFAPKASPVVDAVAATFDELTRCDESIHASPGDGIEIRFRSPKIDGAVLLVDEQPIHLVSCWEPQVV